MQPVIHEVKHVTKNVQNPDLYECNQCEFWGNLSQAVEHAIKNQFTVVEEKEKRQEDVYR